LEISNQDIIEALERIFHYVKDLNYDGWMKDQKTIDAVIRNLEIIGEAAANVPQEIQNLYVDIPWYQMKGMYIELYIVYRVWV
jgi:uncharacterized protein with HEPN domain